MLRPFQQRGQLLCDKRFPLIAAQRWVITNPIRIERSARTRGHYYGDVLFREHLLQAAPFQPARCFRAADPIEKVKHGCGYFSILWQHDLHLHRALHRWGIHSPALHPLPRVIRDFDQLCFLDIWVGGKRVIAVAAGQWVGRSEISQTRVLR